MAPISLLAAMMETQGRIRPQRFFQRFQADDAVPIHRQIGDFKALFFQLLRRVQNGVVLDLRG